MGYDKFTLVGELSQGYRKFIMRGFSMLKATVALIVTFIMGWIGMAIGLEFLGGFTEFGSVVSIAVMGAFIIYFNEKKQ